MAEENRTSQGVSLPDKHGLGFMGCQALLGKPSAFKSKGTCPPPQPGGALAPWLRVVWIMGFIRGFFSCIRAPMISVNDSDALRQRRNKVYFTSR